VFQSTKASFAAIIMNKLRMILTGRRRFLFILTSVLMLMVSGFRSFDFDYLGLPALEVQQAADEDNTSSSEDIAIMRAVYEAIVPVYKIQVAIICNNVLELELIEEIKESTRVRAPIPRSSYFKILFRTFISPNAP